MTPTVSDQFNNMFEKPATVLVRAPGRVNLIGEHTDYNNGYVLPMAINRTVQIALRPRQDLLVRLHALDYDETITFSLDALEKGKGWVQYIKGAAWAMQEDGWSLCGWDGLMSGDVPPGAGLSSSSAVTMAAILAFAAAAGRTADPVGAALLGHRAEDGWVGVHGGIMDQMVCVLARPGHALFLDCRSLETRHIPLPNGLVTAVLDTATRRGLVDSAYNERRSQCDTAAKILGVPALRDVDEDSLQSHATILDEVTFRRARHVVTENQRVLQVVAAMQNGDAQTLGCLLDASHASLRNDFEVSSEALDAMVAIARRQPGCYGARMTGAGFGGCAVALVEQTHGDEFSAAVIREYQQATGLEPSVNLCIPSEGATSIRLTS